MSPTSIVSYLLLFASVGFLFLLASLTLGWLLRPKAPRAEKLETYECGEEAVGSSFIQFDLRFYVVALVFIIFDVEVAFFFPWATVFGTATQLSSPRTPKVELVESRDFAPTILPTPNAAKKLESIGVRRSSMLGLNQNISVEENDRMMAATMRRLARVAMADIAVFFLVLLVGFAYVWSRGDLNWVRSVRQRAAQQPAGGEVLAGATRGE